VLSYLDNREALSYYTEWVVVISSSDVVCNEILAFLHKPQLFTCDHKVNFEVVSVHLLKVYEGGNIWFHSFLNSVPDGRIVKLQVKVALKLRKEFPVLIAHEAGRPPEEVWKLWRRDRYHAFAENRTTISRTSNPQPSPFTD
jgi:hypothetical protein